MRKLWCCGWLCSHKMNGFPPPPPFFPSLLFFIFVVNNKNSSYNAGPNSKKLALVLIGTCSSSVQRIFRVQSCHWWTCQWNYKQLIVMVVFLFMVFASATTHSFTTVSAQVYAGRCYWHCDCAATIAGSYFMNVWEMSFAHACTVAHSNNIFFI